MTELTSVVDVGDQLPSQQIARRIRARMAVDQITGIELARSIGLTQRAFSRRYRGDIEWSVDELSSLAAALRMSFAELTEHTPVPMAAPAPTPGGGTDRYAIRDSNPEPADFSTGADAPTELGKVLQLPTRPRSHTSTPTTGRGATVVRLVIPTRPRRTTTSSWTEQIDLDA